MTKYRLTDKRIKLLEEAEQRGGITIEKGLQHYQHKQSVSESLKYLSEQGFLKEQDAPKSSSKQKIWMITEKGKLLVE